VEADSNCARVLVWGTLLRLVRCYVVATHGPARTYPQPDACEFTRREARLLHLCEETLESLVVLSDPGSRTALEQNSHTENCEAAEGRGGRGGGEEVEQMTSIAVHGIVSEVKFLHNHCCRSMFQLEGTTGSASLTLTLPSSSSSSSSSRSTLLLRHYLRGSSEWWKVDRLLDRILPAGVPADDGTSSMRSSSSARATYTGNCSNNDMVGTITQHINTGVYCILNFLSTDKTEQGGFASNLQLLVRWALLQQPASVQGEGEEEFVPSVQVLHSLLCGTAGAAPIQQQCLGCAVSILAALALLLLTLPTAAPMHTDRANNMTPHITTTTTTSTSSGTTGSRSTTSTGGGHGLAKNARLPPHLHACSQPPPPPPCQQQSVVVLAPLLSSALLRAMLLRCQELVLYIDIATSNKQTRPHHRHDHQQQQQQHDQQQQHGRSSHLGATTTTTSTTTDTARVAIPGGIGIGSPLAEEALKALRNCAALFCSIYISLMQQEQEQKQQKQQEQQEQCEEDDGEMALSSTSSNTLLSDWYQQLLQASSSSSLSFLHATMQTLPLSILEHSLDIQHQYEQQQ